MWDQTRYSPDWAPQVIGPVDKFTGLDLLRLTNPNENRPVLVFIQLRGIRAGGAKALKCFFHVVARTGLARRTGNNRILIFVRIECSHWILSCWVRKLPEKRPISRRSWYPFVGNYNAPQPEFPKLSGWVIMWTYEYGDRGIIQTRSPRITPKHKLDLRHSTSDKGIRHVNPGLLRRWKTTTERGQNHCTEPSSGSIHL